MSVVYVFDSVILLYVCVCVCSVCGGGVIRIHSQEEEEVDA